MYSLTIIYKGVTITYNEDENVWEADIFGKPKLSLKLAKQAIYRWSVSKIGKDKSFDLIAYEDNTYGKFGDRLKMSIPLIDITKNTMDSIVGTDTKGNVHRFIRGTFPSFFVPINEKNISILNKIRHIHDRKIALDKEIEELKSTLILSNFDDVANKLLKIKKP
jgi:hypothetical protein